MGSVLRTPWAKFSLRSVMLATFSVAAVLGVLFHQARIRDQSVKSLRLVGFSVQSESYDLPWEIENYLPATLVQRPISVEANPLAPQFDTRFEKDRETWIQQELGLPPFRETDLRHLTPLRQLEVLSLEHVPVSDAGLGHLKVLHNLRELRLDGAGISDSGLSELLPNLNNLQELYLGQTATSDEAVLLLAKLKKLKRLNLYGTRITKTGKEQLQRLLPNCSIWHESDDKSRTNESAPAPQHMDPTRSGGDPYP